MSAMQDAAPTELIGSPPEQNGPLTQPAAETHQPWEAQSWKVA